MILKIETWVETPTKEPTVVKQLLNEKLSTALKETLSKLKRNCYHSKASIRNNGVDFLWDSESKLLREFIITLWDNDVDVLTPDQVVERMRKGINKS